MPASLIPHSDDASLSGEHRLLAALLVQRIRDARHQGQPGTTRWWRRQQARAWLRAREEVVSLLELAGLDASVYRLVLEAARMEGDDAP